MQNQNETILLLKILPRKYSSAFINKGEIKFSIPEVWINDTKNIGQGDPLEGSYQLINSKIYRHNGILNNLCCCFLGVDRNGFNSSFSDRFGNIFPQNLVSKSYFQDFSNHLSKSEISNKDYLEQPVVLMIKPKPFFEMLISKLVSIGIEKENIIIKRVSYIDKEKPFFINCAYPLELFFKDLKFQNQKEIRVLLINNNSFIYHYLLENNGIVSLGNLSSIVEVKENYYEDLQLNYDQKKSMLFYNDSVSRTSTTEEMPLNELLAIYFQVMEDKLPNKSLSKEEREQFLGSLENTILKRFGLTKEQILLHEEQFRMD